MRNFVVASIVLACAGIALGQDDLKYKDKVRLKNGTTQEVEIIGETFAKVKCKIGPGATTDFNRSDVEEIKYDQGSDLEQAKRALNGNPEQAAGMFAELAKKAASGARRKIFEQHALWYHAVCLHNIGDLKTAAAKYGELIAKYPDTMFLYGASEKAVECYLSVPDVKGAKETLSSLKNVRVDDGGRFNAMRDYLTATVEERSNPGGARGMYEKVAAAAANYPEIQWKAKVGVGRCSLATKDYVGAEKKFREVADSGAKGAVKMAAWNGIGDVSWAKAEEEKNPANKMPHFKAALMAYLRSAIQYEPEEGESWEERAKALYMAGYCFEAYADSFTDAAQKAEYKNRARGMYSECVSQFGSGGGWGGKAAKRLR